MGWYVHFDLDAFFASVEIALRPHLAGQPLVIGGTGQRGVVSCASYPARALGLHAAMPMYRARDAGAVILPVRMAAYKLVSAEVRQLWEPLGAITMGSLDEGFIEVDTQEPVVVRRAVEAQAQLTRQRLGLTVSAGVARSRSTAKIASELRKPGGISVVAEGAEAEVLEALAVGRLPGCGPRSREVLADLGVGTVAELLAADPQRLRHALGARHSVALLAVARGEDPPPGSETHRSAVSSSQTFERDAHGAGEVVAAALREAALAFARRDGRAVRSVTVTLHGGDRSVVSRSETLPAPSDEERRVAAAVAALTSKGQQALQVSSVRLVGVSLELAEGGGQGELFALDGPALPKLAERPLLLGEAAYHGLLVQHELFGSGTVRAMDHDGVQIRFEDRDRVIDPRLPLSRLGVNTK